tara:strand:+ start:166 stop:282 length:117 start_codon:yes stop_codon:yes gene_type:complete
MVYIKDASNMIIDNIPPGHVLNVSPPLKLNDTGVPKAS